MMKNVSVVFLFGNIRPYVNGGTKVVLEYANRLSNQGWKVQLVFSESGVGKKTLLEKIYFRISQYKLIYKYGKSVKRWFALDDKVEEIFVRNLDFCNIPRSDVYVATYVSTAPYLNTYPIECKRKFYFIQDYEVWEKSWDDQETRRTYHYDMTKLVISGWLKDLLKEEGVESVKIPNGFDFNHFRLTVPIEKKDKFSITILYNRNPHKGIEYSLAAVHKVKKRYPQLKVKLFGIYDSRPKELDDWMEYYSNPDKELLNRLYNESSIYIAASIYEGWGLTIGEAMICGCAIACTDTEGFKEMVCNDKTGMLSPIKDINALCNNIIKLIEDDKLRKKIAYEGNRAICKFTWDNSVKLLENTLKKGL